MLTLVLLTGLAAWASLVVADRAYPDDRAEMWLAATVVGTTLVTGSVHLLGWTGLLTAGNLGALVTLASLTVGAIAVLARGRTDSWVRGLLRGAQRAAGVPRAVVQEAVGSRSVVALGVGAMVAVAGWTLALAWLAPSSSWDGLWYHEPMVGWALQHAGFAPVPVPTTLDWVNGYPRASENLMLWSTIFFDRRLIDMWPSVFLLIAAAAFYVLGVRVSRWRAGALGFSAVLFFVPGAVLQLRSTYIDTLVLASYLLTLAFVTRRTFRSWEIWFALLAAAFLAGTKATGVFYGAMFVFVVLARAAYESFRTRDVRPAMHWLAATLAALALAAPGYARNWTEHRNPIWPLRLEVAGVVLEGPADIQDMQRSVGGVMHELFGAPEPGQDYHDTRKHAYGYAIPFVALPLGVLAWLAWCAALGRSAARRDRRAAVELLSMGATLLLGLVTLATSPAYYWARYSLPAVAVWLLLVLWYVAHPRRRVFAQGSLGAMIVLSLVTLWWSEPGWDVSPREAVTLARLDASARVGFKPSYSSWSAEASLAREAELGRGDVAVFDDRVAFVGNLWNERMDNIVRWVPFEGRRPYLHALEVARAKWAVVTRGGPEQRSLAASERWKMRHRASDHVDVYVRTRRTDDSL